MGNERVGSVKWALEGHRDPVKHLIPAKGARRPGEMGSLLNGSETRIRWKRGEEPKLGYTFWGHGKQSVGGGGARRRWRAGWRAPRRGKRMPPRGRAGARGASTCRRAGRAAQVRKRGRERSGHWGTRHEAPRSAGTGGAQGTAGERRARLGRRSQRGVASGRAAGRREPLTCAAEAELQQPMAGPEEPGGGAGRAATPRSPSACEPAGARGGRGLAPHDSAATAATATAARTQEAARSGAGAGHIPRRRQRRRRRLRGSGSAPAAAAAPQRKGAGGGGSPSPWPPPPTTRSQSHSRSLSRAAAASSSAPRASPIRLPAPSAAPRGADGGDDGSPERGRALGRAQESARRRAHFAVAPRPSSASGRREGV